MPRAPAPPPPDDDEPEMATRMLEAVDFEPPPPQRPLKPADLRIVAGPDRGKTHRLGEGTSLVGRGLDCQIVLSDPAVSRKHFKLERDGDAIVLFDLGSANGTVVNGAKPKRHDMEEGDRIEVGTTTLEFHIEGGIRKRGAEPPMVEVGGGKPAPAAKSPGASGGSKKPIVIIAVGVVVLLGGVAGAYFALKGKSADAAAVATDTGDNPELTKALAAAKRARDDKDFTAAEAELKKAKQLAPDNGEVKSLLAQVHEEQDFADALEEARELAKKGEAAQALEKLKEIDDKSVLHSDAEDEAEKIKKEFVKARLDEATKAQEAGDTEAALKAVDAALKVDPDRADAKARRSQLTGDGGGAAAGAAGGAGADGATAKGAAATKGAAAAGDDAKAAVPAKEAAPAKEAVPAKEAAPGKEAVPAKDAAAAKAAAVEPAGSKKADFGPGMAAYKAKNWSEALKNFSAIAEGPSPKDQKAKAAGYAAAVKELSEAVAAGGAPGTPPAKVAKDFSRAYGADKRVDGTHGPWLAGKVGEAYLAIAKDAFGKKKYAEAMEAAQEAQNYVEKPEAGKLEEQCRQQAGPLLAQAKAAFDKKNYGDARDLARQVARLLPSSDPRAVEAQAIAKKANDAQNADN